MASFGRTRIFLQKSFLQLKKPLHATAVLSRCSSSKSDSTQTENISRFPVPELSEVPEDLRQIMQENLDKGGFIPNVFKVLARRPAEMRAFLAYYDTLMNDREGGNLSKADKEMVVVAISALNKCRYCIVAHSALFRLFSKDPILADQVSANWETADLDCRQKAILEFAVQNAQCKVLTDAHFQALYDNGLDDEDAWDIGAVVALFSLSNRMAFLTSMAPNKEFYLLGRVPKSKSK